MAHPWEPTQILEPWMALELIQTQFPELSAKTIRLLGAGWDNTAFIINDEYIFRFPRREIALPLLKTEMCALPKLAPFLPLPIPIPKWKGEPTSTFPWLFVGYQMLPGVTACHVNLLEEERMKLAEPLGNFLATLHATPQSLMEDCDITTDNKARIDGGILSEKIKIHMEELALLGLLEGRKELEKTVTNLQNYRAPEMRSVVHGDLYVRHLLVDERHQLTGVIDWGDIHVGDPAIDLSILHSFLPKEAEETFRKAYGEISDETSALSKLRAIYSSMLTPTLDKISRQKGIFSMRFGRKLNEMCEGGSQSATSEPIFGQRSRKDALLPRYVIQSWRLLVLYGHHSNDTHILREGLRSLEVMR